MENENKAYPKIKHAVLLCLLILGIQLLLGIIDEYVSGFFGISKDTLFYGISMIILDLLSFGAVIVIGFVKSKQKFNDVFRFNKVSLDLWAAIIIFMIGFIIVSSEIDNVINYIIPMPDLLQNLFETVMVKQMFVISIILVGIIPAFTEEMFFRGVLLNGFQRNYSDKKAILISSLIFGIIHLNPWQFVTAFIIGLVMAWVCINTKSIILCIYMHLFNNVLNVIAMRYKDVFPIQGFITAYSDKMFQPIWFDLIGIIITALGVFLLIRAVKKANLNS